MRNFAILAAFAVVAATPVHADDPAPNCEARTPLTGELAGWERNSSLKSMRYFSVGGLKKWPSVTNSKTGIALHPIADVQYWASPDQPIKVGSFGGMVPVNVTKAGRLKVALSDGAWMDLVRDGAALPSVTHGHAPDCSGIRKIVEFNVIPGTYLLQIANSPNAAISAMAWQP